MSREGQETPVTKANLRRPLVLEGPQTLPMHVFPLAYSDDFEAVSYLNSCESRGFAWWT